MTKKQFEPETWKRKTLQKNRVTKQAGKNVEEMRRFDVKANRPFWWRDTSWLSLEIRGSCPKGYTTSLMVMLKVPVPTKIVDEKLEQAFGDIQSTKGERR